MVRNDLISAHLKYDAKNGQDGPTRLPTNPRDFPRKNRRIRWTDRRWGGGNDLISEHLIYGAANPMIFPGNFGITGEHVGNDVMSARLKYDANLVRRKF